jgi:oligoribonuclease NrnB/cAMP/cGMP phosphodiesterase (DHH superfamily)
MNRSGAVMTYEHFFPDEEVPEFFLYIQDRDLWRFDLPQSKEFSAALESYKFDFKVWDGLIDKVADLKEEGVAVLKHMSARIEMICNQVYYTDLLGYEDIPCVNTTVYWSEVGDYLKKKFPDAPFVSCYHETSAGKRKWSLRCKEDFNVAELAETVGGGGHAQASGFIEDISEDQYNEPRVFNKVS